MEINESVGKLEGELGLFWRTRDYREEEGIPSYSAHH